MQSEDFVPILQFAIILSPNCQGGLVMVFKALIRLTEDFAPAHAWKMKYLLGEYYLWCKDILACKE